MARSLDTNAILRLLLNDIEEQALKVRELIGNSKSNSLLVTDAAIFEMVWVLSGPIYQFNRQLIREMLVRLMDIQQIQCNRLLIQKSVDVFAQHPELSFIDAYLAMHADLTGNKPLLTFDKQLARKLPKLVEAI